MTAASAESQRIDRWLWHARMVRTRASAAALAQSGHVRLNGQRIKAPACAVRPGDVLTIALPNVVKVLRVIGFSPRRGGSSDAKCLFEDLSPPKEQKKSIPDLLRREPGTGRPTKKDRRAVDRLRGRN